MRHELACTCIYIHMARKASWNLLGVVTVHWKPTDSDPGSLILIQIQNNTEFGVGGTNQPKGCLWGRNPTTSKLCLYVYTCVCICHVKCDVLETRE